MKPKSQVRITRRSLLAWSTPTIAAITLPAHANTSDCMDAMPVLTVTSSPKCSGTPPVGTAVISITSSMTGCPVTIKSISSTTDDDKSDIGNLPDLPIDADSSDTVTFEWNGPASDSASCLPLAQVDVTIEYCCDNGPTFTEMFDLTDLLLDSATT